MHKILDASDEHRCTDTIKYKQTKFIDSITGSNTMLKWVQRWFNIYKSIKVILHIKRIKYKIHMTISIDIETIFDKIQHPFIIKFLKKLGIEEIFLNIYDK